MRLPFLTLALTAAIAAPASAAPTWLEPVALSPSATDAPTAAMAPTGEAAAAWSLGGRIEARVRAPGSGFGPVQVMGAAGSTAPVVGMADDGTAILAWVQGTSVGWSVRPPGGSFGAAQEVAAGGAVSELRLDVNAAGSALIAFVRDVDDRAYAALRPAGGVFEKPMAVSAGLPCNLDVALGDGGHAAVAWHGCGPGGGDVHVARRKPGAGFAAADIITTPARNVAVAVSPDGSTAAVWEATTAIRAASATPDSAFGQAQRLSPDGEIGEWPSAVSAGSDLWAGFRTGGRVAARRVGGGPLLIAAPDGSPPAMAGGADGTLLMAWIRSSSGARIEAARRPAGVDAFDPAQFVSAAGSDAGGQWPAVDASGNAGLAYGRDGRPELRVLDAAGPRFGLLDVRQGGFALETYPFGLEATDAWSAVASTAIDFGDGTSAPGPRAEHSYAAAGERTVTFSATDAVGNASHAQRPFTVLPPLDRTPPVLTNARLDSRKFRVSRKETAVTAAVRRGTRLRYTISEPAQANIFFERVRGSGRLRNGQCQRGARRGRRCRIYAPTGFITRRHPLAGAVSVGFSGRITARNGALRVVDVIFKPGRYRVTITAADANRNVSAPVELGFTIRR